MAQVALGIGTSHSPMLSTPYESFAALGELDRTRLPEFAVMAGRNRSRVARELDPAVTRARHDATQAAIGQLAAALAHEALDALVVIGDDQGEWFSADSQPALCIYWGDTVESLPPPRESLLPLRRQSYWGYYGDGVNRAFPVDAALGRHLVESLTRDHEFDVAHVRVQPRHAPFGHAWGFVHQRLVGERAIPIVPVLLNTYYPPNQPSPRRCYKLGQAIRDAIEAYPENLRVGVVASGGLSHFTVDETLDGNVIRALREKDANALQSLPREQLKSGSSEIRNWICAAGALEHLDLKWVQYAPGYRTLAGTGTALCFGHWA